MRWFSDHRRYGLSVQIYHFFIAFLFIPQLVFGFLLQFISKPYAKTAYMTHKGIGVILFWLILMRLINRLIQPVMPPIKGIGFSSVLARYTIIGLLCVLFCLPLSGWVMSSAADLLPWLPGLGFVALPIPQSKVIASLFHAAHLFLAYAAVLLLGIHIFVVVYNMQKGIHVYRQIYEFILRK